MSFGGLLWWAAQIHHGVSSRQRGFTQGVAGVVPLSNNPWPRNPHRIVLPLTSGGLEEAEAVRVTASGSAVLSSPPQAPDRAA